MMSHNLNFRTMALDPSTADWGVFRRWLFNDASSVEV